MKMIKHIVFFKLIDNKEANCKELANKLTSLKNEITQIVDYEVGINFSKSDRAYDVSLISSFESEEDMATYAKHSKHLEFMAYSKKVCIQTKVVDYRL